MTSISRRTFLTTTAAAAPALTALTRSATATTTATRPVAISSGNGAAAVQRAVERMRNGADPLHAVVAGVKIVEDDPEDQSVGYGGLPNENGVVQLDASVMHGPTHKAGAVAALEGFKNPASVALEVLRRTDHVLLVGEGARDFAIAMGFDEQNLLTDESRAAWLRWKANINPRDDWLDEDQRIAAVAPAAALAARPTGTIHCAAVDAGGDIGATTSTSGLAFKIPGRVGDSPIVGAGMFVDNGVGAAGSTGRGEAVIQSCGAFSVVRHMAEGKEPTEACLAVLQWIADHTLRADLLDDAGRPDFNVVMYALRKDGVHGAAAMRKGPKFAVDDGAGARLEPCAFLFD